MLSQQWRRDDVTINTYTLTVSMICLSESCISQINVSEQRIWIGGKGKERERKKKGRGSKRESESRKYEEGKVHQLKITAVTVKVNAKNDHNHCHNAHIYKSGSTQKWINDVHERVQWCSSDNTYLKIESAKVRLKDVNSLD